MIVKENLPIIDVTKEEKKATLTFLDQEAKEVYEVSLNLQSYDSTAKKFHDDPEKAERVEKTCQEYLGCSFADVGTLIGKCFAVYLYDKFNSLYPVDIVEKFTDDMYGEMYETTIKEVKLNDYNISIRYDINGKTYQSKMTFGKYVESLKQWFLNPQDKERIFAKFKNKFGVPVEECDKLVGVTIIVEVKKAFGSFLYGDIKKFPKKGK